MIQVQQVLTFQQFQIQIRGASGYGCLSATRIRPSGYLNGENIPFSGLVDYKPRPSADSSSRMPGEPLQMNNSKPKVLAILPAFIPSTHICIIKPMVGMHRANLIHAKITLEYLVSQRSLEWADLV